MEPAMPTNIPKTMQAIAIDQFGGVDKLKLRTLPVPTVDADEVLVRLEFADAAVWDPIEREGYFEPLVQKITGKPTPFPVVLGTEGAGTVAAVGADVSGFKVGDRVYVAPFLSPKGGCYAEYVAVKADVTSHIPGNLSLEQAAVMPHDAGTALRGLDDVLHLKAGESVMLFGAGGGLGHFAVQLAKRLGARVFAVASGDDGAAFVKALGADAVVNGRKDDVVAAAKAFAPEGLDAALLAAGGDAAEKALAALHADGRIAYPNGVMPVPKPRPGLQPAYDGNVDRAMIERLNKHIAAGPFVVHVAKTFPLEKAADAHRYLGEHYLGKIALKIE
jgi:NADPH:quinone reductase-like Zn-dependent oxidoreductase